MRMSQFLLACFVASATFFATCDASALTLDKSSSENTRILTNLNSASNKDGEGDSNAKLESSSPFEPQNLENIEENSHTASKDIQDPNNIQPITKHIAKRCIHPITKQRIRCPLLKKINKLKRKAKINCHLLCRRRLSKKYAPYPTSGTLIREERSNEQLDFQKPYLKKPSPSDVRTALQNLFKTKFSRDTDSYRKATDKENISEQQKPNGNEDEVTVVVGRNIVKGRGKKKFICYCHEDNCKGKHCEPSRPNARPTIPSRPDFIGPEILNSDRNNKNENIYQLGPIYDPVYYIQNVQRQNALLGKSSLGTSPNQVANPQSLNPNSPLYFPQNPLTQYSNIVQPVYYFDTPYNQNPVPNEYPYDNVGSARTKEDNEISMNECIRHYGRDFCAHSAFTQQDSLEEHTQIYEDEESVLGAEAPDYEQYVEDDYIGEDYDEMTEPSWHEPLEPLEPDDDTLGTFYEDDNDEYFPLKSEAHDSDEATQYKSKESIGKAVELSQNSRHQTMSRTGGSELVRENQSEEILASANLGKAESGHVLTEAITDTSHNGVNRESEEILGLVNTGATAPENIGENPINDGSEEIRGSVNVGQQFFPDINMGLKEKTIRPASKEILADIPSVSLAEDYIIGARQEEVATSSEEREIVVKDEMDSLEDLSSNSSPRKPIAEVMYENLPSVAKTTKLAEESNGRFLGSVKTENSEEGIVAMEPPDETINSEPISEVNPANRKYETGAAKSAKSSFRSKPMTTKSSIESSLEVENPKVISSESEKHQVDSSSKEMVAKTVITSSKSRPITAKTSIESSLEVNNPRVISSEFDEHQVDAFSKEKVSESGEWFAKRTKVGEESNDRFLGAALKENSEEEIVAMEPPDGTINSKIEPISEVRPGIRKYETGAAKSTKSSSRSRPMTAKSFTESSLEIDNPRVISSESEQHQVDSNSKGMVAKTVITSSKSRPITAKTSIESSVEVSNPRVISSEFDEHEVNVYPMETVEKTPTKYYSPQDRLLDYKKNHQNEYHSSAEQFEHSASSNSAQEKTVVDVDSHISESKPRSKIHLITQPKEFQTDEEDEILVAMSEGSGMFEEEGQNKRPLEKVRYLEDYEGSGDVNEDDNPISDKNVGSLIENSEKSYVSETTVAENENIDDQYTGAAFTEDSGKSREGDNEKEEIMGSEHAINEDSLVGSSKSKSDQEEILYTVSDGALDARTNNRNNKENNHLVSSSKVLYSVTDRTLDARITDQNYNEGNQSIESSRKKIYEESSRTSKHDYSGYQKEDAVFEEDDKYSKYEKGMMRNDPLIGKARSDESGYLSQDIYYIPKASELEDKNIQLGAANSNYRNDLLYLGKILPQHRKNPRNSENSDLTYIGDGVRLPLKTIKLNDGSYSLALSDRICEHLLKINCPCYIQRNQHGVEKRHNDEVSSMKDDDDAEERDFKDYSLRGGSKNAGRGKMKASVDDSGRRIPKDSLKESIDGIKDEKRVEEQYTNYVQTLLDVNDIPKKERAEFVTNALDRVVNDEDLFSVKENFEAKKGRITLVDSTVGKVQSEKNKKESGSRIGYDTSKRVELLKAILSWVKDLVFTAANRKS